MPGNFMPTIRIASVFILLVNSAFGQGVGTIHGAVSDATGKAVPNAKVTAVLEERNLSRSISTDDQGTFVFPSLPIGRYAVHIEATGFKAFSQSGVELTANENARVISRNMKTES